MSAKAIRLFNIIVYIIDYIEYRDRVRDREEALIRSYILLE